MVGFFIYSDIYIKPKNIMKKIIRMTESDLTRLVRRVIKEQSTSPTTPDEIKKMADEIKRGVGTFGNTNVRTLENAINYLRLKEPSTILGVYKELGIQSLAQYLNDKLFMANQISKGQKNNPMATKMEVPFDAERADRILSNAKRTDAFLKSNK